MYEYKYLNKYCPLIILPVTPPSLSLVKSLQTACRTSAKILLSAVFKGFGIGKKSRDDERIAYSVDIKIIKNCMANILIAWYIIFYTGGYLVSRYVCVMLWEPQAGHVRRVFHVIVLGDEAVHVMKRTW